MANSIQAKNQAHNEQIRQIQQEKADKKKALNEQAQQDIKDLRARYQNESQKLDQDTTAAINHIKQEMGEDLDQERLKSLEAREKAKAEVYNRRGETTSSQKIKQSSITATETKRSQNLTSISQENSQTPSSQLIDQGESYLLKPSTPDNQENNLRLNLQENKAILTGKRKFDSHEIVDGKKISSKNFQIFREEIPLSEAISVKDAQEIKNGQKTEIILPKLERYSFSEDKE